METQRPVPVRPGAQQRQAGLGVAGLTREGAPDLRSRPGGPKEAGAAVPLRPELAGFGPRPTAAPRADC